MGPWSALICSVLTSFTAQGVEFYLSKNYTRSNIIENMLSLSFLNCWELAVHVNDIYCRLICFMRISGFHHWL
jgi:hypothetical protein